MSNVKFSEKTQVFVWLEKEPMAIHSSILAWKIPWTEEPGGLQSLGSQFEHTHNIKFAKKTQGFVRLEEPGFLCHGT